MSETPHAAFCVVCLREVEVDFYGVFRCLRCRTEIDPMHMQQLATARSRSLPRSSRRPRA